MVIARRDLVVGCYYEGDCRNASLARWNGSCFIYLRQKFGDSFWEAINHSESERQGHDTFRPTRLLLRSKMDLDAEYPLTC